MTDREDKRGDNILLVGYRGTGKSTLGKRLADVSGMPFIDMDQTIVEEKGSSISEIVEDHGWSFFRTLEKNLLIRLSKGKGQVIATGGGVVLNAKNRTLLREMGRVVWLQSDPEKIVTRLTQDKTRIEQRPALSDLDLWKETNLILQERSPLYENVHDIAVNTSESTVGECVDEIIRILHIERTLSPLGGL
ncbi:MAG: shikimate kinase [Deltaproteobacteria bacterium]|nr:shikimate kinase [Deltaproteobacteria bacterium]